MLGGVLTGLDCRAKKRPQKYTSKGGLQPEHVTLKDNRGGSMHQEHRLESNIEITPYKSPTLNLRFSCNIGITPHKSPTLTLCLSCRDLKPENVLLKDDRGGSMRVKIIDFGTSNLCGSDEMLHSKFGTPYYVAPEVLRSKYAHPADVWSCGVIMYILLCGCPPFGGRTDDAILHKIMAGAL